MGEVVSIQIGSYDFLSYKNTFGDLLSNENEINDIKDWKIVYPEAL
jgi:hypothetical protein